MSLGDVGTRRLTIPQCRCPLTRNLLRLSGFSAREVIKDLVEENRVLREQLKGHRLRLHDDQRRRLARKGHQLGRRLLSRVATIVTPDTILRGHRRLIAKKWSYPRKRLGRPGTMKKVARLIVRMATDNPTWGYSRIQGALKNLNHRVARSTIARVLKEQGIPPVPERPTSWRMFLRANWGEGRGRRLFHNGSLDGAWAGDLLKSSLKPVIWMGASREDLRSFPEAVRRGIGQARYTAQQMRRTPLRSL